MTIATKRLLLRRPHLHDLDAMFEIMSDPVAMRYWSTLPHASVEVTRIWLEEMIARCAAGGEDFIIEMAGRVIGTVGAGLPPHFGFMVRRDYWGQGVASEASLAFVEYAFTKTAITELQADVDPRNTASLRALDRLGFIETGRADNTFLLGDEWFHSVYLTLSRPVA